MRDLHTGEAECRGSWHSGRRGDGPPDQCRAPESQSEQVHFHFPKCKVQSEIETVIFKTNISAEKSNLILYIHLCTYFIYKS